MKKLSGTLKSVISLSLICAVCVSLLTVANRFWSVKTDEFAMYKSVCPADSYTALYGQDSLEILEFNQKDSGGQIISVTMAVGGEYNGGYVVKSGGEGYNGGAIVILIGYDPDGLIIGYATYNYDITVNNFFARVSHNSLFNAIVGKTTDDAIGGGAELAEMTGATAVYSLNGVATAFNLSNKFFNSVIKAQKAPDFVKVTEQNLTEKLLRLYGYLPQNSPTEFIKMNYSTPERDYFAGATAAVTAAYFSPADGNYIIIETKSRLKSFGGWTALTLIDLQSKSIIAVTPLGGDFNDVEGQYAASSLNDTATLTSIFAGLSAEEINSLAKYLTGAGGVDTTGATQSNHGIKAAVICAVQNIDGAAEFLSKIEEGGWINGY